MKINHKSFYDICRIRFLTFLVLFSIPITSAAGQSTDRDRPTRLSSNEIRGEESGKAAVYYYTFTAGPGEIVVTADGKTDYYSTTFEVKFFDTDSSQIGRVGIVATGEGKREVGRFRLARRQPIVMQLVFNEDANVKNLRYMVRLEGAVEISSASTSSTSGNTNQGILRIEMKDGSIQQIELSRIRRISIEP